jgi:hypothetical protein
MGIREEYLEKEWGAWDALRAVLASVPADRLDDRTVVPGWSAKDLVWHCAGWATFAVDELERGAEGPFANPFSAHDEAHWDGVSQEMVDRGRVLTYAAVLAAAETQRERVRRTWSSMAEVDGDRARWFAEETFGHYDEHAGQIRRWLDTL